MTEQKLSKEVEPPLSVRAKRIEAFREKVYVAINHGKYLPSDFMYMHESLAEQMTTMGQPADIVFTPGGITLRARLTNQS